MSTIEEAREQAREALEQQTRAVQEGYGMSALAVNLRDALQALLDATEPPAHDEGCEADWGSEGQESPCRCATPTDRPSEDEREALVMTLYANGMAGNLHEPVRRQAVEKWADAILADGDSKGPRPITDEMVEAAARASFEHLRTSRPADHGPYPSWEEEREDYRQYLRNMHRPALEAAEGARR